MKLFRLLEKSDTKILECHELFDCLKMRHKNVVKPRKYYIAWKKRQKYRNRHETVEYIHETWQMTKTCRDDASRTRKTTLANSISGP